VSEIATEYLRRVGYLGELKEVSVNRINSGRKQPDYFEIWFDHDGEELQCVKAPVLVVHRTLAE
jgi:hypothetical protein